MSTQIAAPVKWKPGGKAESRPSRRRALVSDERIAEVIAACRAEPDDWHDFFTLPLSVTDVRSTVARMRGRARYRGLPIEFKPVVAITFGHHVPTHAIVAKLKEQAS